MHEFNRWALDYLVFGNGYLEVRRNMLGEPLTLLRSHALVMRCDIKRDTFVSLQRNELTAEGYISFPKGRMFHLIEPDITQEINELPQYLCGVNSILLN